MESKTKYFVSYITKGGCVLLNIEVEALTVADATAEIRQVDNVLVILSCVSVPKL